MSPIDRRILNNSKFIPTTPPPSAVAIAHESGEAAAMGAEWRSFRDRYSDLLDRHLHVEDDKIERDRVAGAKRELHTFDTAIANILVVPRK